MLLASNRPSLINFHVPRVADHVGGENCRKSLFDAIGSHGIGYLPGFYEVVTLQIDIVGVHFGRFFDLP